MKDNSNKRVGYFCFALLLTVLMLAISLVCINCSNVESGVASTTTAMITQPEPYFPVQKEKPVTVHQLLLQGTLLLDEDGYLRVGFGGAGTLVIWPYGYSFKIEDENVWILDEEGNAVFRVGDEAFIGGLTIGPGTAAEKMGYPLPEECEGPFWLAGEVRKAD